MKKLMKLLMSLLLAVTLVGCSSNSGDDSNIEVPSESTTEVPSESTDDVPSESINLEEYGDCLQRVMDEAAAAGTDMFDMSVCDNL
jgi:PBP1b-binding outer membrane lipoprotein LpoB